MLREDREQHGVGEGISVYLYFKISGLFVVFWKTFVSRINYCDS